MISIKRYLDHRRTGDTASHDVGHLLLSRIGEGAVSADEGECLAFRAAMQRLAEVFADGQDAADRLRTAEIAAQLMEDYNQEITVLVHRQRRELKDIVTMTAETVATISGENARSAEELRAIGDQFERPHAIGDLDALKAHVGECLQSLRLEIVREQEERDRLIVALRQEIEKGPRRGASPGPGEMDAATGLPQKAACVDAMRASIPAGKRRFAVTFVLNRLRGINLRFGREIGDRILCRFGEFVEQQILPSERLFRWSGPTFVAVLERGDTLEHIRAEVRKMLEPKIEETIDVDGRFIMIPVSAVWTAFQLLTTVTSAERQIDGFAASQDGRDYL